MKLFRPIFVCFGVVLFGVELVSASPLIQSVNEYIEEMLEPLQKLFKDGTIRRVIKQVILKEAGESLNNLKEDKTLPQRVLDKIMNDQGTWMDMKEVTELKKEIKYGFNSGALTLLDSQVDDLFCQMMDRMKDKTKEEIDKTIDKLSREILGGNGVFGNAESHRKD